MAPDAPAPSSKPPFAWQPLTARGVAAFSQARNGRVLILQFVFALLTAAVVVWFLQHSWFPVIRSAIANAPAAAEIRQGQLSWGGASPVLLAEGRFLAIAVDPLHEGSVRSPAHVGIELGRVDLRVYSLFGYVPLAYPRGRVLPLDRDTMTPWWGAWSPPLLALTALTVIATLLLIWGLLAAVYTLPTWLIGFFANRDLDLAGSWRVAGAALLPGALFMDFLIVIYGLGMLDLVRLGFGLGAHLVVGWVYIWMGALRTPPLPGLEHSRGNPFQPPAAS